MTWVRLGDTAATDPARMRLGDGDELLRAAAWGWLLDCCSLSGQHMTDGVFSPTLMAIPAPKLWPGFRDACVKAGLIAKVARRDEWVLTVSNKLIHVRTRRDVETEQQRKRDNANVPLNVQVRFRDGDACRYCQDTVYYWDHNGGRGGTYDSLTGHQGDATVDTQVVCCRTCNSARGAIKDTVERDRRHPLRPAPAQPYYFPSTVTWLAKHGHQVTAGEARPGDEPDTAARRDPAARTPRSARPVQGTAASATPLPVGSRAQSATPSPTEPRATTPLEVADGRASPRVRDRGGGEAAGQGPPIPVGSGEKQGFGPGRVGSGRVGSGGWVVPDHSGSRRGRRGRRGRDD